MAKRNFPLRPTSTPFELRYNTQQQQFEAFRMRLKGHSYEAIAAVCGCTPQQAKRLVDAHIKITLDQLKEKTQQVIEVELSRLDELLVKLQEGIESGDTKAINAALKISERRSNLLGLDKPIKVAATDPEGTKSAAHVVVYVPDNGRRNAS